MSGDWSARVFNGYSRPSGAATFAATRNILNVPPAGASDPNTAALSINSGNPIQSPNTTLSNVALVVGLFLVTVWLESGNKKGGLL